MTEFDWGKNVGALCRFVSGNAARTFALLLFKTGIEVAPLARK
jgi:hypothetical protein